jgi:DNA-binding winged helix-turn-helix (wHTH) protein/tetratricopeptide (TPR) repeat protein
MKEFPPFRLDAVNECVWRRVNGAEEQRILITPKAFAVLRYLLERAGRLVTQNELLEGLWSDTYVQPEVIKSHIRDLRKVLGDDPKNPRFIETVPRRGYRFIATVADEVRRKNLAIAPPASSLVGRDRELDRLRASVQRALRGERQLVFVTGELGIGKTALVDAFQLQVAAGKSVQIGRGQCVEGYAGQEPYYPVLEALAQLCRGPAADVVVKSLAEQAPTWLIQFPGLVKREQREELHRAIVGATRERMLREIADALQTITAQYPLLLVLEDMHWADRSTVDLLSLLGRRREPTKLMLIGTYRPVDVTVAEHPLKRVKQDLLVRHLCDEIALEPLSEDEVGEYLLLEARGAGLPPGFSALIHRYSEGNPLFMVAAVVHLRDRGLVALENDGWQINSPLKEMEVKAPESLRQMIELQIERLSAEEQRVLEVASVLREFSLSVTIGSAVTDIAPENLEQLLEGLARRHQVIRPAGFRNYRSGPSPCYEIVHALYRDVLYSRIGPTRRRALHKSMAESGEALHVSPGADVATVFPEAEIANELAHHFEQSGNWLRAIKYLQVTADTARRRFEPKQAAETLEHALSLVNNLPEAERARAEIDVLQKLCTIYSTSFDPRALHTYEVLADRGAHYGVPDAEGHALLEMAFPLALVSADYYRRALDRAFAGALHSEQIDTHSRAGMRALYLCRRMAGDRPAAEDLEECRNLVAQLRDSDDHRLFGEVELGFGHSLFSFSRYRQAQRSAIAGFARFVEDNEEYPYVTWHSELHQHLEFSCPLFLGEWGDALRKIDRYIEDVEKNGDRYRAIFARIERVELQIHALDFAGAQQFLESAYPMVANISSIRRQWLIWAGSAEAGLGNHERALEYLRKCREEMDQQPLITDSYNRILLQWALTTAWLSKGELAPARIEAEQFLNVALAIQERTFRALAFEANARVALAQGELPRAEDCIARGMKEMEGFETPLSAWRVHATASELYQRMGQPDAAQRHGEVSRATIMELANSLPAEEPLRRIFLSAPMVREILRNSPGSQDTHAQEA